MSQMSASTKLYVVILYGDYQIVEKILGPFTKKQTEQYEGTDRMKIQELVAKYCVFCGELQKRFCAKCDRCHCQVPCDEYQEHGSCTCDPACFSDS